MEILNGLKNLIPRRKDAHKKLDKPLANELPVQEHKPEADIEEKTRVFKPIRADEKQLDCKMVCICKGSISYKNAAGSLLLCELGSARVNIGRIYENEIYIRDSKVSRLHAFIVYENNEHVIYDAQSTNGTYVNNQKVANCRLKHGDSIKIGSAELTYQCER